MSEIVERVAAAIDECLTDRVQRSDPDPVFRMTTAEEVARASIAAMRWPTYDMRMSIPPRLQDKLDWRDVGDIWRAMIDEALKP
jgi:hypothetical protein